MTRSDDEIVTAALVRKFVADVFEQITLGVGIYIDAPGLARNLIEGRTRSALAILTLLPHYIGSRAYDEPLAGTREVIGRDLRAFLGCFPTFERFREVDAGELREATVAARAAYGRLMEGVHRLIREGGIPVPSEYLQSEALCEGILDCLFDTLWSSR